jgi:Family of unknown function (DUF5906)
VGQKMTEVPKTGRKAGSDSIPENPALTGGVFRSGSDEARYITGQFNAHMASCLLLQADEAVWAGDKAAEGRLKGIITSETQMIESKGVDPIRLRNFLRVIMTSNEGWVVPAGMDERRFCVLDVGSGCAQNHEYFGEMDDELNAGGRERLNFVNSCAISLPGITCSPALRDACRGE